MRILHVEDNSIQRNLVAGMLGGEGHDLVSLDNPTDALNRIGADGPAFDLLIADVELGHEIGGWAIARAARRRSPSMGIPYLSAETQTGQGVGGSVFLRKPCTVDALARSVDAFRAKPTGCA